LALSTISDTLYFRSWSRSGVAIAVVTKAISTAMVKKFCEITPMSRPILTTTISIKIGRAHV